MSIYKMSKEAENQALERLASGVRERAEREREARRRKDVLDTVMAELCARLREHFEASGHPGCPDPECDYVAYENTEHAAGCAYAAYVEAQDAATGS